MVAAATRLHEREAQEVAQVLEAETDGEVSLREVHMGGLLQLAYVYRGYVVTAEQVSILTAC